MTTPKTQARVEGTLDPMLATSFSDFWHRKWPHQTRDVKKLEMSAHYIGCRDAFIEGARAALLSRALIETDGYVGGAARLADKWLNDMTANNTISKTGNLSNVP